MGSITLWIYNGVIYSKGRVLIFTYGMQNVTSSIVYMNIICIDQLLFRASFWYFALFWIAHDFKTFVNQNALSCKHVSSFYTYCDYRTSFLIYVTLTLKVAMPSQSDVTALPIWRIQKLSFFLTKYTTVQLTRKVYFISIDRYFFLFIIVMIFFWFGSRWVENLRWK